MSYGASPPKKPVSTGAKIGLGCGGPVVLGLVLLIVVALVLDDGQDDIDTAAAPSAEASASPSASPAEVGDDQLDAEGMIDELAELHPLPNLRDTTGGCQLDHVNDCTARITTDAVSVYELEDEELAAHWVEIMGEVGDARQAGRFMLLWPEGSVTSDQARDDMVERARELAE